MINLSRQLAEMRVCLSRGASAADRASLVTDGIRFHLANQFHPSPRLDASHTYRIRVGSGTVPVSLRPHAGDFFVFHEVFTSACYTIPAEWRGAIRTVVDLGAHVGLTTLFFLESLPAARVVCVEASPDNAELLRSNLRPFAQRTHVIEGAVGAGSGVATFDRAGWSWGRRVQAATSAVGNGVVIRGVTIDEVIREAGIESIDLLKVDIEGAEEQLFAECEWLERVAAIIIELHDPYTLERFSQRMKQADFRILQPDEGRGNEMIMAVRTTPTRFVSQLLR